ncbi:hypothetical protein ACFFON_06250 [Arthrobacter citreus]|uniref:hypothetical protein n=1 Tax=Arthrobacter TaxID=1663 RepID=UPI0014791D75|nr:hypothetical protein [Arthrobacter gandavensis]
MLGVDVHAVAVEAVLRDHDGLPVGGFEPRLVSDARRDQEDEDCGQQPQMLSRDKPKK